MNKVMRLTILIFVVFLLTLIIAIFITRYIDSIDEFKANPDYNQNITSHKIDNSILLKDNTSSNGRNKDKIQALNKEDVTISRLDINYDEILHIPYSNEWNGTEGVYVDESRDIGPEAFSIIQDEIFILDNRASRVIVYQNNMRINEIEISYPICDFYVVSADEMYFFGCRHNSGIYHYK